MVRLTGAMWKKKVEHTHPLMPWRSNMSHILLFNSAKSSGDRRGLRSREWLTVCVHEWVVSSDDRGIFYPSHPPPHHRVWTEKEEYLSLLGLRAKAGSCLHCWRTWHLECSRCKAANPTLSPASLARSSLRRSRCWSPCARCTRRHLGLVWTPLWCFGSVSRMPPWWSGHQELHKYTITTLILWWW